MPQNYPELLEETLVPLAKIEQYFPNLKPRTAASWATAGRATPGGGRAFLKTFLYGRRRMTSKEEVKRFVEKTN